MNNILLISEDTLKTYSNLNRNTFGDWILPAIRESQEMGLMPIIGECLYNKICELVADGSISDELFVAYKDLLDDKIQPYLIYKTLSNIIPIINGKLANIGTVTTNDEHIVNLSQGEADLLKTYYSERCDFYTKRLQDFIKNNASAFPEIACGCGNMQPNLDSSENSVGLWLGGSRGKKINDNKCACSSTGITCGDYQSGFTDGVEFQKRKLAITGFTENGRYIREDGYSEVTVEVPQTGHTDEELYEQYLSGYTNGLEEGYSEGYTSGSTDGYNSGYTSGETHQKSLLSALTITQNGDYSREDGYSAITVNVSGQSATLTTTAVTANGEYTAPQGYDGFSSFEVNVPQTGYTQQDLDNAYASGETHQKSLMVSTAVTQNGVYTRSNGFSAITVNVPQTGISGTQIAVSRDVYLNEFGTYYFIYDSATSLTSMTIHLGETPTAETYYTITYTSHDGNIVRPYSGSSSYDWGATYLYNTYSNGIGNIGFYATNGNKLMIKPTAFLVTTQLKEMWIPTGTTGKIYNRAFAGSGIETIHIPDDITEIWYSAFSQAGLKSLELPSSITKIEYDAFWRCSALTSVTVYATTPPTATLNGPQGWRAFDGSTCPIYVPSESVDAYKAATGWSDYADRIQAIQ